MEIRLHQDRHDTQEIPQYTNNRVGSLISNSWHVGGLVGLFNDQQKFNLTLRPP